MGSYSKYALYSTDYIRTDRTVAITDTWLKLDFAKGVLCSLNLQS